MGAILPVAAALARDRGATVAQSTPVLWNFLGYPFEAGSMIAALCACVAVRFYVAQKDRQQHRWTLDAPVSVLALLFTASAIIRFRPDPALALAWGTTFGVVGAGLIALAKKHSDKLLRLMGLGDASPSDGA